MADRKTQATSGGRARDIGLEFKGETGTWNAITDVPGVTVGLTTIIEGKGEAALRTGVTAILPRGAEKGASGVWAGAHSFNGNGEMTGLHWVAEAGWLRGPVLITNTHSVGMAHHAAVGWIRERYAEPGDSGWVMPVIAETCDHWLSAMDARAVSEAHVLAALNGATGGPVPEGSVGGGTGMIAYEFKAGNGTASRRVAGAPLADPGFHVGVLVQANFGRRADLMMRGIPVGEMMPEHAIFSRDQGSIIGVLATDAPLHPLQLQRLARRMTLGMARTGSFGGNGSGDLFVAFSTAGDPLGQGSSGIARLEYVADTAIDALFAATVDATEEAILNAIVAGRTMTGRLGRTAHGIDTRRLSGIAEGWRSRADGAGGR